MKRSYLIIAMTAGLAACNNGPVDEPPTVEDGATSAVISEDAVPAMPPAPSATVPTENGGDMTDDASDDGAEAMIPAALQGRWGINDADCTTTKGDDKGLITVSANQVRFYESIANLGKVSESSDSRIAADFAFTGEGQSWSRGMILDVQNGGNVLVRRETGADAMPGPLRYRKCG